MYKTLFWGYFPKRGIIAGEKLCINLKGLVLPLSTIRNKKTRANPLTNTKNRKKALFGVF